MEPVARTECFLTPPQIAKRLRVCRDKVLAWIRKGDLRAFNVSDGRRPRYRVSEEDLAVFLNRRAVHAQPKVNRRRKPEYLDEGDIDYYAD